MDCYTQSIAPSGQAGILKALEISKLFVEVDMFVEVAGPPQSGAARGARVTYYGPLVALDQQLFLKKFKNPSFI